MTAEEFGGLVIWMAKRVLCIFIGHEYVESRTMPDGSVTVFECELCVRCDTPKEQHENYS